MPDLIQDILVEATDRLSKIGLANLPELRKALGAAEKTIISKLSWGSPGPGTAEWLESVLAAVRSQYKDVSRILDQSTAGVADKTSKTYGAAYQKIADAVDVSFARPDEARIVAALQTNPVGTGGTIGELFTHLDANLAAPVVNRIRRGYITGETVDETVRALRGTKALNYTDGIMAAPRYAIERYVRTFAMHVSNITNDAWMQSIPEVEKVEFVATLDSRTCPTCGPLDGKTYDKKDATRPRPPMHPNCRCLYVPVVPDWFPKLGIDARVRNAGPGYQGLVKEKTKWSKWAPLYKGTAKGKTAVAAKLAKQAANKALKPLPVLPRFSSKPSELEPLPGSPKALALAAKAAKAAPPVTVAQFKASAPKDRVRVAMQDADYTAARKAALSRYMKNTAPPPAAPDPAAFGASLRKVSDLGGSTGAWLAADSTDPNALWVVKQYLRAASPKDSVANEYIASQLYRMLGVNVPESRVAVINGQPAFVTKMVKGKELSGYLSESAVLTAARKGFVTDALLANWDAVGMGYDNMLVEVLPIGGSRTIQGYRIHRIDLGGSLLFRAQGSPKGTLFGKTVGELESFLTKNPQAAKVFGGISPGEIVGQIGDILAKWSTAGASGIVQASPLSDNLKGELIDVLQGRVEYLEKIRKDYVKKIAADAEAAKRAAEMAAKLGAGAKVIPKTVLDFDSPSNAAYQEIREIYDKVLSGNERTMVEYFTSSGYRSINEQAYKHGKPSPDLVSAIDKLPKTSMPAVLRKINATTAFERSWAKWTSGDFEEMEWKAFSSTTWRSATWSGDIHFAVVVNPDLRHGVIGSASSCPGECEVIVNAGQRFQIAAWGQDSGKRFLVLVPKPANAPPPGSQPPPQQITSAAFRKIFTQGW